MKSSIRCFLVLVMLLSLSVAIANAATLTIRPDAQGARTAWGNTGCSAGASEYQCVDEVVANTSDYLQTTGTSKETFTFSNTGLTSEAINSVTMYYYSMQHNSASNSCFEAMTRSGGTDYQAGVQMCGTSSWSTLSHAYSTNPSTGVAWTVSDIDSLEAGMAGLNPNGGGRVSQVYAVVDYDTQPVADANAVPTSGVAPLAVNFTGGVTSGESPYSYLWNFQDGTNSTSQNPQHTFTSAGSYNVSFKVTDNDGDMSTDYVLVIVSEPDPFDFSVGVSPSSGTVLFGKNISTNFTATLVSGVSQSVSLSYSGCPTGATCSFSPGSITPTATSVFKVATTTSTPPGVYVVNLTGTGDGKERSALYTVTVTAPDLIIDNIVFNEYTGSNGTMANVTVTVKNQGTANAGAFYVTSEHLYSSFGSISSLNAGQSTTVTADYVCTSAHSFNSTADSFAHIVESNEANNFGGPVYIDCII